MVLTLQYTYHLQSSVFAAYLTSTLKKKGKWRIFVSELRPNREDKRKVKEAFIKINLATGKVMPYFVKFGHQ